MFGRWDIVTLAALSAICMGNARSEPPTIALAPIGDASATEVAAIRPALVAAFGREVIVTDSVPLPAGSYSSQRKQYLSTAILDSLASRRKPECERLLGVADVDLYVPDLNFVFGEADEGRKVAVFSLWRLRPGGKSKESRALLTRRAATEAIHELGHTYGLGHCQDPHCVMWFSNTLAETDRKGTEFCPAHAAELRRKLK